MSAAHPTDETFMRLALDEAMAALKRGDRPIGAVIVHNGAVVSQGSNAFHSARSDIAHAELAAILASAPFLQSHGSECTVYTTCEPCPMCIGAIVMANIRQVVFGMPDNYTGGRLTLECNSYMRDRIHRYDGGLLEEECIELFRRFSPDEAELCLLGKPPNDPPSAIQVSSL